MHRILLWTLLFLFSGTLMAQQNLYSFTVKDIDGKPYSLRQLKGKKVMIVNVASRCGFTPQYEALEKLYKKYQNKNFVIIGFPANNFKNQEPGTNQEIKKFCTLHYGVTFPMMAKISVRGDNMAPLYHWLTEKKLNGKFNSKVKWNFQKYLINSRGEIEAVINPQVKPDAPHIIRWIESKPAAR
jgi:glutathione peroxidase